jgi:hypothetical protein
MQEIIAGWVGKSVSVTLQRGSAAVTLDGKLLQVNDAGVLLQLPKGQTYVPVAGILHVSRLDER